MTPNVVKWRQFDDIGQLSLAAHDTKSANVAKHEIFGDIRASISRGDGGFPPSVAVISPLLFREKGQEAELQPQHSKCTAVKIMFHNCGKDRVH